MTGEEKSWAGGLIEAFWDFVDREDPARQFLILVSFVALFHIAIFLAGHFLFFPSDFARTYLSGDVHQYFIADSEFYIPLWAVFLLTGILFKRYNKDFTILMYAFVFAYCFSHLQQSRYSGVHSILTPLFMFFDITIIALFLGAKFGIIAIVFYSLFFPLEILLEQSGILKWPSTVLADAKYNDVFRNNTYITVFASLIFMAAFTCGLILIHSISIINRERKALLRQNLHIQRLTDKLSVYLPRVLVQLLERGEGEVDKRHKRVKLTILISEFRDFTHISEVLQPEDTSKILNMYITTMSRIVGELGGTVEKFVGDSIIVYFGGIEDENYQHNALQAAQAAINMQAESKLIQEYIDRDGLEVPFKVRIGINTGYVTIGSFGSEMRKDYTIIGREVNNTSFIKDVCKPGEICVSYNTYLLTKDQIDYEDAAALSIEGLQAPLAVYRLLKEKDKPKEVDRRDSFFTFSK